MIHVCYGLYDRDGKYSKFCGTSIVSIFENTTQDVTIHLLHDNTLTTDNRDKFIYLAGRYNQQIEFYNVEILAIDRINYIKENCQRSDSFHIFSIGAFYRLLIPQVLSENIDKVIYLDAGDTLVNLDIYELWKFNVNDYPLAAQSTQAFNKDLNAAKRQPLCNNKIVKEENYFASGLLLMNLNYFRENMKIIWLGVRRDGDIEYSMETYYVRADNTHLAISKDGNKKIDYDDTSEMCHREYSFR